MGNKRPDTPRQAITFYCKSCRWKFTEKPSRVEPFEERPWHPFEYFAECPLCHAEVGQAHWEISLFKAHANATGPKTPEGKAASANNIVGHPTPEEAQITRFNAVKHLGDAKVARFFPARPGKYPHCEGCEHLADQHCKESSACLRQAELFIQYAAAFEKGDPSILRNIIGDRQAALNVILDQMILIIAQNGGPEVRSPEWYHDKDGGFHLARYKDELTGEWVQLFKTEEHPLLKRVIEMIAKNNMALEDMGMTPKVHDEQEALQGFLDNDEKKVQSAQQFQGQISQQQNALLKLIEKNTQPIDITKEGRIIDG